MKKTDEEWKQELTPEQYRVLREQGTEAPGSGKYILPAEDGVYTAQHVGRNYSRLRTSTSRQRQGL